MPARCLISLALIALAALSTLAEPPRVVAATPDNGDADVDPALKEIRIVFDQPMSPAGHSIVGGGPTFPKITAKPRWADPRTLILPVQLEPGREYWLSVNNQNFTSTRNKAGEPAIAYPIAFKTAAKAGAVATTLAPDQTREMIAAFRKAIDDNYAYRDRLKLDWDKLFADAAPKLQAVTTPAQFAREAARLLEPAKDIHMSVKVGDQSLPTFRRSVPANINVRILPQIVRQLSQPNNTVWTGKLQTGATYIAIHNWNANSAPALETAFEAIGSADPKAGIILDVRANAGGDELLARQIAGCFVSEPKVYSRNDIRKDGKRLGPYDRTVQPTRGRPFYRGKVAVLIGPYCMSSNESFINMMKVAGATLVGERTYGSSGNPRPHDIGNGVTVVLPSWRDLRPDGTLLEGNGIPPDVEVKTTPRDFTTQDPVLDAALKHL